MIRKKWIQEEIDFLKKNYGKILVKEIAKKLKRTEYSIFGKAQLLNIKSDLCPLFKKGNNNPAKRVEVRKKMSLIRKGKTYKELWGEEKAEEWKKNIGKSNKNIKRSLKFKSNLEKIRIGKNNPFWHKHHTEKWRREHSNRIKKLWKTKEYRNLVVTNTMKGQIIKPNFPERQMIQIIKENNFPFNYVGDGKVVFDGFNPDFLSKNPKHIIEVFGDYWHHRKKVMARDKRKFKAYASLGYKTLIIWQHELEEPQKIVEKIKRFIK
jgi:very-short-patch-repair endonuclease